MAKQKRKGAYGIRYSDDEKNKYIAAWQQEASKVAPRSKSKFCKDMKISTITFNGWLKVAGIVVGKSKRGRPPKRASAAPAAARATRQPEVAADQADVIENDADSVVVIVNESRALALVVSDAVGEIVQAIKDHQERIQELKGQLREIVDAL